jgi:hypothetical protein
VIRAYRFLLRPTARQTVAPGEMLQDADRCSLYNGALQERRDAYRHTSKTTVRYGDQSVQLKDIRAFDPERQGRWSFSSQQATRDMQALVKAGIHTAVGRTKGRHCAAGDRFPQDVLDAAHRRHTIRDPYDSQHRSGSV